MTHCLNADGLFEDVDLGRDRGFLVGDGVFETLRIQGGAICWLEDHLQRLSRHAQAIGLTCPWALSQIVDWLGGELPATGLYTLRLSLTAGAGGKGYLRPEVLRPRLFALIHPAAPAAAIPCLEVCPFPVPEIWPAKTLSGLERVLKTPPLGRHWVLVRHSGVLTECPMANIFWVRRGRLETPQINESMLGGLTRERVLLLANSLGIPVREDDYHATVLDEASEIFTSGSVAGLIPVMAWGERSLSPSPVRDQLHEAFEAQIKQEIQRWHKCLNLKD